jgi:gliding motility-associated-like protein
MTLGTQSYSYSWISLTGSTFTTTNSGNQTSISGLSAGAYQLTVNDSLGCEKVYNYIITEPDSLTIDGLVFTNAKCKGECSATISFNPSGGTPDYTVYLYGVPIGPAIDSVIISANEAANNADSIYTFDSICPGNYLVYLMDANNCNIYTQTIIQISEPQTVFNAVSSVLSNSGCNDNDGQIQVTASGGSIPYNVSWQNLASMNTISPPLNEISQTPGSYLIDSLSTATYLIYVIDANGCLRSDTLEIDSSSVLFAGFTALDTVGCGPFEVQFTNLSVGQNLSYFWSFGNGQTSTSSNPVVVFQTGGPYDVSLTVTNLFGCSSTYINTGYIVAYGNPTAAFTTEAGEIDYYTGFVQFINNSTNASSYVWNFGDGSQTSNAVNPSYNYADWQAGTYLVSLTATDTNGCFDMVSSIIESNEIVRLTVPNSFTINGDNLNDMFKPVFSNYDLITSYSFDIYNRWGERIYSSNDVFDAWDGKYKDKFVQFGTYTWVITYRDQRAFDINVNGHVTVLR